MFFSFFFQVRPGLFNCSNCTKQCKSKGGLTRHAHAAVKRSENPEKENTQKEIRKDTMAKDSVFVELTEEKVITEGHSQKIISEQMLPLYIMCGS